MPGPRAATRSSGREPRATSASTARAAIPAAVPRHPACAAATSRLSGSTRRTGRQSAVWMPRRKPGAAATEASASGVPSQGASTTVAPWTCRRRRSRPVPSRARATRAHPSSWLSVPRPGGRCSKPWTRPGRRRGRDRRPCAAPSDDASSRPGATLLEVGERTGGRRRRGERRRGGRDRGGRADARGRGRGCLHRARARATRGSGSTPGGASRPASRPSAPRCRLLGGDVEREGGRGVAGRVRTAGSPPVAARPATACGPSAPGGPS